MHDEPFKMTGLIAEASCEKQEIWVPGTLNRAAFAKKERLSHPASSMDSDRVHAQFVLKNLCTPLRCSYEAALYFIRVTACAEVIEAVALRISWFNQVGLLI
jgi:hypothetical protein